VNCLPYTVVFIGSDGELVVLLTSPRGFRDFRGAGFVNSASSSEMSSVTFLRLGHSGGADSSVEGRLVTGDDGMTLSLSEGAIEGDLWTPFIVGGRGFPGSSRA